MPISAYIGSLGSGKSYEVVFNVIIPACLSGRRVVTNIYGINEKAIHEYCVKKKKVNIEDLGSVIYVDNDKVKETDFFPYKNSIDTFCVAGDLICIDESWRIWDNDKMITDNQRSFIAEHRHFVHLSTGVCCDLVVINQDIAGLPRFIKQRLDTVYRMQKHLALGLKNRYRVDVFTGCKLFKSNKVSSYQRKYESDVFPLYQSYDSSNGKEITVDKRQSIFSSKFVFIYAIALLMVMVISGYFVYSFFSKNSSKEVDSVNNEKTASQNIENEYPIKERKEASILPSSKWRVSGKITRSGKGFYILSNSSGGIRFEPISNFNFDGAMVSGVIDDEIVTKFSARVDK